MQNSFDEIEKEEDFNWERITSSYSINIPTVDSIITFNLTPSYMLASSQEGTQYNVELSITQSKKFMFTTGLGWNWQKYWNIPDINCFLNIRDSQTKETVILPESEIYAEIYVATLAIKEIDQFLLEHVGIRGANRSFFENSQCSFKNLKFSSTSYNYEGSKFHLVIVVYLNQGNQKSPIIIESRVSRPIHVENSHGTRRQYTITKVSIYQIIFQYFIYNLIKLTTHFFDPFLPEYLSKKFVKRESKRKYSKDLPIENDIDGLSNYVSAPNIRHKIKHPLFLALKFSNCVKVYHNINTIPENDNCLEFIKVMQKQLQYAYIASKTKNNILIQEKPLILCFEHLLTLKSIQLKKIKHFFSSIYEDVVQVIQDPQTIIPENFIELKDIENIKEAYTQVYAQILHEKYKSDESDNSDIDSEEGKLLKKIRTDFSELETVTNEIQKLQINNSPQQIQFILEQNSLYSEQNGYPQVSNFNTKDSNQLQSILGINQVNDYSTLDHAQLSVFANSNFASPNLIQYQTDEIKKIKKDIKYIGDDIKQIGDDISYGYNSHFLNHQTKLSDQQNEKIQADAMNLKHQTESNTQQQNSQLNIYGQTYKQEQPNILLNNQTYLSKEMNLQTNQVLNHQYIQNMMIQQQQYNPLTPQQQAINQIGNKNMQYIQKGGYQQVGINQQNNNQYFSNSPSQNPFYYEQESQFQNNQNQFYNSPINQQYCDFNNQQRQNRGYLQGDTLQSNSQQFYQDQSFNTQFQQFQHKQVFQQPNIVEKYTQNNFINNFNDSSTSQLGQNLQEQN
ncbi:hypothetical protein ABPG72_008539 [Tetrahymena utriculariae]